MITYDQDPDIVRWGLQLFDADPYSDCGYCGAITQNVPLYYHHQYCQEDHYDMGHCNDDNNEINEQSLQEELSQLSVAEPAQIVNEAVEHQMTFYSQDWFSQPVGNYDFGDENGHEVADDSQNSGSCSSPEGKYFGEDWSYSLELTDQYALDDEVGKRFNQMVPIPHIPRINGEIPSVDEASLDHQRLLQRLQLYELVECKVQGDGNCQFRALSDQFYRTPEHHKFVRQQVVNQLKSCPENYEAYVPMAYNDYLKKMSKTGEWGDHVTLQAAADSYGVKIFVITSFKDTCYIEILPNFQKSERDPRCRCKYGESKHVIFLSFWAEVHYNSIYPEGDMPTFETKKKMSSSAESETWESPDDYD